MRDDKEEVAKEIQDGISINALMCSLIVGVQAALLMSTLLLS